MNRIGTKDLVFIYDVNQAGLNKEITIPVIPLELDYSYTPGISTQAILGRITPLNRYTKGGDETYSFSVKIHNDMLINKTLVELVKDIKMLSYPVERNGVQTYPKILFELGEITGTVIVDTNITWQKPIINGHYALVEIMFNLRIVRKIQQPQIQEITRDLNSKETYTSYIYTGYSEEEYRAMLDKLKGENYDTSVEDFIKGPTDASLNNYLKEKTERELDAQKERLNSLYDILVKGDYKNDSLSKEIEKELGWIKDIKIEVITDKKGNISTVIKDTKNKKLSEKKIKKLLAKYQDKYYQNTQATSSETEIIFEGLLDIMKSISDKEAEVVGYAARS